MQGEVVAGVAAPAGDPGAMRDAAVAMRRIGSGFSRVGDTVSRAVGMVTLWEGRAQIEFQGRCMDHQSAASQADVACILAGDEIERYASDLQEAIDEVRRMQREAEELEAQERRSQAAAADARDRVQSASVALRDASMVAVADGGASVQMYSSMVSTAQADATSADQSAASARARIEELQRQALAVRERIEERASQAADRIWAAEDELPAPFGAPGGSAGEASVTSVTEGAELGVTLFTVLRVAGNTAVIKERSADGRWHVTMVEGIKGGATADIPGALVSGSAGLYRLASRAKRFDFDTERQANQFVQYRGQPERLPFIFPSKGGPPPPMPAERSPAEKAAWAWANGKEPVSTYTEGGDQIEGSGKFSGKGEAGADVSVVRGTLVDAHSGLRTTYVRVTGALAGHLQAGPVGNANGSIEEAVTRDEYGHVHGYSVNVIGETTSGTHVGADTPKVGYHSEHSEGTRTDITMQLDLNDPANRQAVEDWLNKHDPASAVALDHQLSLGRTDEQTYHVVTDDRSASVTIRAVGIDGSHHSESATMTSSTHSTGTAAPVRTQGKP